MPRAILAILSGVLLVACAGAAAAYDNLFICSASTNEVYRYKVQPGGAPILDLTLSVNLDRPAYLALNPTGTELFVVNRSSPSGGAGSIARFLDPNGSPTPNGVIADQNGSGGFDFSLPHDVAFRGNEMFVVNSDADNVLRFTFDGAGVASSSGIIIPGATGQNLRGIVFGPGGNMFLTLANTATLQVREYGFDGLGQALAGPVFSSPGFNDHGMAFSPWGELFVTEANTRTISRYLFDASGNPLFNGQITGNGLQSPIDLTFSGWGELFVANSLGSSICRWNFTAAHDTISNGTFTVPSATAGIQFGSRSIAGVESDPHAVMSSSAPYPNPTLRDTRIGLELTQRAHVSAEVYDCSGKVVRALMSGADLAAGAHTVSWDGNDARGRPARPGIYFVRFRAGPRSWSERVAVLR